MAITFPISRGKKIRVSFLFEEDSAAMDLTGYAARLQIRPNVASLDEGNDPLLEFTTTAGTILPLDDDGYLHVEFDDVTATTGTANPCLADAVWDVELTPPGDVPYTLPDPGDDRWKVEFGEVVTA
jgi:hypothetical protein